MWEGQKGRRVGAGRQAGAPIPAAMEHCTGENINELRAGLAGPEAGNQVF